MCNPGIAWHIKNLLPSEVKCSVFIVGSICCLGVAEDFVGVLDDELHGVVFGVHVGHFAF